MFWPCLVCVLSVCVCVCVWVCVWWVHTQGVHPPQVNVVCFHPMLKGRTSPSRRDPRVWRVLHKVRAHLPITGTIHKHVQNPGSKNNLVCHCDAEYQYNMFCLGEKNLMLCCVTFISILDFKYLVVLIDAQQSFKEITG